uniref:RBPJ-interacting and tubulin-associated protein 1 n=1 Tax=Geotrypetes seraphini TaxID=260995 RepID=A0A6P8S1A5_GEOSA|nr:LOW QUALITY PROTEIN: RBPJ-interacting and tubulin-associated protein 1 [Geotrypetes seraphini]
MSTDLMITGIQAFRMPRKVRSAHHVKSSTSFVDETLFRSPHRSGRLSVPDFDPPWTENIVEQKPLLWSPQTPNGIKDPNVSKTPSPGGTLRKYRLKNHFPSYCDETLFGQKKEEPEWEAPWVKKKEKPKLRPLLWIPLSTPKLQIKRPVHFNQLPLKAIHSQSPTSNLVDLKPTYKTADLLDSPTLNLECRHSNSLNHLQKEKPSVFHPSPNHCPPARVRSSSFSESKCLARTVPMNSVQYRPPWR